MNTNRVPPGLAHDPGDSSRRAVLQRLFALPAISASSALLTACGGGSSDAAPVPAPPPPPPITPLSRLKQALQRAPLTMAASAVTVTQGLPNSAASSFGSDAVVYPPLGAPNQSLATIPQVWGHRRDLWDELGGAVIEGHIVYPVQRVHRAATLNSAGVAAFHFEFDGAAFELLFAGTDVVVTLVVDGQYVAPGLIRTTLGGGEPGALLMSANTFVRFDFGVRSTSLRQISVYALSSQGPCSIAVRTGERLQAWDRSGEASFGGMADSYGGARGPAWRGGPFWEAAALLGVPNLDLDAIGGTGYAPNATNLDTVNPGNNFPARLTTSVNARPDLFITGGGLNDNNSIALPPYASPEAAQAGFRAAVARYYGDLRAALPDSVLVALAPWAPRQSTPTNAVAQSKADVIKAALQASGGPWVFLDNLNGGWVNSAGANAAADGPWQTGTGNMAAPAGGGNGDLYLFADGVHPNEAGCRYLGTRIATDLRAALLAM